MVGSKIINSFKNALLCSLLLFKQVIEITFKLPVTLVKFFMHLETIFNWMGYCLEF